MRILSLCCVALLTVQVSAQEPKEETAPSYYPLTVGSYWKYSYPGGEFSMKVTKTEKVGETLDAAKVETLDKDGKLKFFEHLAAKEDGIYRLSVKGIEASTPVKILQLPLPEKGASWDIDTKVSEQPIKSKFTYDGTVDLKVGDKEYKGVAVVKSQATDISNLPVSITYYLAPNVGMVKQIVKVGAREVEINLQEAKIAPKK